MTEHQRTNEKFQGYCFLEVNGEYLGNYPLAVGKGRVYKDTRLAGVERYIFTDDPSELMLVPEEIKRCVAFFGYYDANGKERVGGTVFFVSRQTDDASYVYAVTARHNIDDIKNNTRGFKKDKVCLRLNVVGGKARWIGMNINKWKGHPNETPYVDVAACRFDLEGDYDHEPLPIVNMDASLWPTVSSIPMNKYFGVGDEVFFPGLFSGHFGSAKNIPIIRIGNIAAMDEEPVATKYGPMEALLIEARSIGGLSGSPVFAHVRGGETLVVANVTSREDGGLDVKREMRRGAGLYLFMGLVHGHYKEDSFRGEDVNMGIGLVVPGAKVLEVLEQEMFTKQEEREDEEARQKHLPTTDSLINTDEELTRESFQDALRRSSRKTSSQPEKEKNEK